MGDETQEQKATNPANTMGPPTGMTEEKIAATLKTIKLAPGFKIDIYASGVNSARQMAWGDKGTLFVGSFGVGTVYAIVDNGGKKEVKAILKGLKMPTGVAHRDGASSCGVSRPAPLRAREGREQLRDRRRVG